MDDYFEIDLRKLIKNILRKWYWVLIPAVLIGLGVYIYSSNLPDLYEAKAILALVEPAYEVDFTGQDLRPNQSDPSEGALQSLVQNDKIASALFDLWDCPTNQNCTLNQFRNSSLGVEIGERGQLVTLIVTTKEREKSALIANTWADLSIDEINRSFYGYAPDLITYFDLQTELFNNQLEDAGQRLIDFEAENTLSLLKNQLSSLLASQVETLRSIRVLQQARADSQILLNQLAFESPEDVLDSSYRLSLYLIQSRIFTIPITSESESVTPLQINVDLSGETGIATVGEFVLLIENWIDVIDERLLNLSSVEDTLNSEITSLQAQIQSQENVKARLRADYERIESVYEILALKNDEIRVSMPERDHGYVRLVSSASVPDPGNKVSHNTNRNMVIGILIGAILGLAAVVVVDWWQMPDESNEIEVTNKQ
ncbi:MAG: hypothetical protein K0B06_05660 [Brevefilum sp.]|nr:hypothetical protein [Brevefilum sp.]